MTPPPTTPPAEKKEGIIPETVVQTVEPTPNQSENESIEETPTTCSREEQETSSNDTPCLPPEKIEIVDTPQPSPRVTGRTRAPKPGRPGRPRGRRSQRRSKSVTSTDNETEVEEEKEEDNKSETMEVESEKTSEKDEEEDDMESTVSEKKDDSGDEQESIDDDESGDRSKDESYLDRASTIGSESVPASPASQGDLDSDALQAQKNWKKSIMLVWRAAANHKYANVFLHPVTDDEAPGYHGIVFRPMDLTTIKKNIENGSIRTTSEFQRDMMLMFQNALMYNNADHDVYRMAEEMRDDVMDQIQSYIATQLMVQSSDRDSTKMLRGHRSDVFHFFL
ncbi:bromodomain-containing protein 8 isoform X2 [Exaiptasia diaphana]|uniref:Bromo domain-containing protein n=1 Tax=Exaiptasia diaphana TaxID=2652724 RepID=A0A913YRR2_EXADI|nr:bromodomain-containing protein 8 isoform X2 [Exaiptasia diaphana]